MVDFEELRERIGEKKLWLCAVVLFVIVFFLIPFPFNRSFSSLLGSDGFILKLFLLFLGWFIRCIPSLFFVSLFYEGVRKKIDAMFIVFLLLILMTLLLYPAYWVYVLISMTLYNGH